jgi:GGDEF domain-containing protein
MFNISISYGISVIPDNAANLSDAIHIADMDMYRKKNTKKNSNPRILNFSQVKSSQL